MTTGRIGNNKYLKKLNKTIILDLIRTNKGISRKALADMTGLSPTATGQIVRALLEEEYICEVGEDDSSGGRRPMMLELNPASYYAFGFDIDSKYVYTVLLDITGKTCYEKKEEFENNLTPEEFITVVSKTYEQITKKLKLRNDRIIGAGISIPGMLELPTQKILLAPNLGWSQVDIKSRLTDLLNIPVLIDNEAICSSNCEDWLGTYRDRENFICINIDSGIGAGLFVRGAIYKGHSGSAGEIGHIPMEGNSIRCKCGKIGCLETISSVNAMVSRYKQIKDIDHDTKGYEATLDCLINGAEAGDTACMSIFKDAAVSLGKVISYLINIFNPQEIILGKKFSQYSGFMLDEIRQTVKKTALAYPLCNCQVLASTFGEDSSALGAATLPIRKLFGH